MNPIQEDVGPLIRYLVDLGADAGCQQGTECRGYHKVATSMDFAIRSKETKLLRFHLDHGFKFCPASLILAAEVGNEEVVQMIYASGADMDSGR